MTRRNPWYQPIAIRTGDKEMDGYFLPDRASTRALDPGTEIGSRTRTTPFARLFVGLAPGSPRVRRLDRLADIWRTYAASLRFRFAESVVLQRGLFTIHSGRAVREDGAVLTAVILPDEAIGCSSWTVRCLVEFGGYAAARLRQRACVVQNGHGVDASGGITVYPHIPNHLEDLDGTDGPHDAAGPDVAGPTPDASARPRRGRVRRR